MCSDKGNPRVRVNGADISADFGFLCTSFAIHREGASPGDPRFIARVSEQQLHQWNKVSHCDERVTHTYEGGRLSFFGYLISLLLLLLHRRLGFLKPWEESRRSNLEAVFVGSGLRFLPRQRQLSSLGFYCSPIGMINDQVPFLNPRVLIYFTQLLEKFFLS